MIRAPKREVSQLIQRLLDPGGTRSTTPHQPAPDGKHFDIDQGRGYETLPAQSFASQITVLTRVQ